MDTILKLFIVERPALPKAGQATNSSQAHGGLTQATQATNVRLVQHSLNKLKASPYGHHLD